MADDVMTEGADGFSVGLGTDIDEASFQQANQRIGTLFDNLKQLAKLDFKDVSGNLKAMLATAGGVINFTIKTNMDEVQNMLKATKAGLTNEDFKKWANIEVGLGLGEGSITQDLANIYEQVARITSLGQLDTKQFLALGLIGENANKFIDQKDNTQRVKDVLALALKSERPTAEVAVLLEDALGSGMADLYRQLKVSGKDLGVIFDSLAIFTSHASQLKALDFNLEYNTAVNHLKEMGALLASTFGDALTPLLTQFNNWVRKYRDVLSDILTFQHGWLADLWTVFKGGIPSPIDELGADKSGKYNEAKSLKGNTAELYKQRDYWLEARNILAGRTTPAQTMDLQSKLSIQQLSTIPKATWDPSRKWTGATLPQQREVVEENVNKIERKVEIADLVKNYISKQSIIGKDTEISGYKPGVDYSKMTPAEKKSVYDIGVELDLAITSALLQLSETNVKDYNELVNLIKSAKTIDAKTLDVDQTVFKGQQIYTPESFEAIYNFLEKIDFKPAGGPTGQLQINNTVNMAPSQGMSDYEVKRKGTEIGMALGEEIRRGINYAMYSPGALS